MKTPERSNPITGIIYSDGAIFEAFLHEAVEAMASEGMRLAGLIQRSEPKPDRLKCDMHLLDLATGNVHKISDDRGPQARGCVLNTDCLLRACEAAERGLNRQTDLLVLCKFGKAEAEGGGFRTLMTRALELAVPVLIGVPPVNLEAFRAFAANFAREIELASFGTDVRALAKRLALDVDCVTEELTVVA